MAGFDATVAALREALKFSPDNLPLRLHLADTLLGAGRPDEAEREYKTALARWPDHVPLKVGLATAFFHQGKSSMSIVVVEELLRQPSPPARARLLYARLLLGSGDVQRAVRQYKQAVEEDQALAD